MEFSVSTPTTEAWDGASAIAHAARLYLSGRIRLAASVHFSPLQPSLVNAYSKNKRLQLSTEPLIRSLSNISNNWNGWRSVTPSASET